MDPALLSKFLFYTWEEFDIDAEKIARAIEGSSRRFYYIYGPPCGAFPLVTKLHHRLGLESLLEIRELHRPNSGLNYPSLEYQREFHEWEKSILVVDDIADTGKTLKGFHGRGIFIATIFRHPNCSFEPDISIREKDDRWIIFPWEDKEKEIANGLKIMNSNK